jgi:hypothetical protein
LKEWQKEINRRLEMKLNLKIIILVTLGIYCAPLFEKKKESMNNLFAILFFAQRSAIPNASVPGSNAINIGGKVTGLANGSSVTLQLNGGERAVFTESKSFQNFFLNHRTNTEYKIEVKETVGVTCTVQNAIGTPSSDITNADLTCASGGGTVLTKIGGTVTGITGSITLDMTGDSIQSKTISTNGIYQFDTSILDGKNFTVTIGSQSNTSFCYFPNANASNNSQQTGIVAVVDTTNVNITCVPRITLNEICSNTCTGSPGSPGGIDFIELKNISGANINISGTDWYSCDAGICGGSFNASTPEANLISVPAQTFNNNAYLTPTITYGLGNGDTVFLVYRTGGKNYLVETYVFAAHVIPARKSPDGNFSGATNSGNWLTGGTLTYGIVNP